MSAADFAELGGTLLALASFIMSLGSNYYQADAAWDAFPLKVLSLEQKHARLQALLEKYGQDGSAIGLGVLQRAKELMLKEVEVLKRREEATKGVIYRFLAPLTLWRGIVFPGTIGLAIQNAEAAYDGLEKQLKSQQENEEVLRGFASRSPVALSFREDRQFRYVSFQLSESRIVKALKTEGVSSSSVILLHGGTGTGKSTVTREIMLRCAREKMFTHVVRLECGPSVDVEAKVLELLQKLGWNELPEMSQLSSKEDGTKFVIRSRLQGLLAKQKLLICLDDLWELSLLQRLLTASGPEVRYLVTSQSRDICKNLTFDPTTFRIEDDLTGDNAKDICKRMLAAHIGFADQTTPDNFQEVADKLLCQAKGIPLVIATLGAQIGKGDKDDLAVWRSALDTFLECLEDEKPSMHVHGVSYEKSYWSALKSSIDSLGDDVRQMLLLISMCRGPSIPQAIVFLLFKTMCPKGKRTKMHFTQMQNELKSLQLVSQNRENDLSIHSLAKSCILKQMSETIKSIAGRFIIGSGTGVQESTGFVTRTTIIHILVCLYLDEEFGKQVARQMDYSLDTFSESKKTAIQSITQQLAVELEDHGELHQSASLVFVQFVCEDSLCADHLLQLLQCPTWRMPTLTFLQSISALDELFWKKNTIQGILPMFESILGDSHQTDMQIKAADTLRILVPQGTNLKDILNRKFLQQQLVDLMGQAHNASVQCSGARFFVAYSYYLHVNFSEEKFSLVQLPQLLHILVKSLEDGWNADLQMLAAHVLLNLAATINTSFKHQILRFPLLLGRLAASLKKSKNPRLQNHAAWAIINLARAEADQAVKQEIQNISGLLDNLEWSLDQDSNQMLQLLAARALIRLERMEDTPKLLRILVESLELRDNPDIQNQAACGLRELVQVDDVSRDQILSFPGLLDNLGSSLDQDSNRMLQVLAATVLITLERMENTPKLLRILVESLEPRDNPDIQNEAARGLRKLALVNDVSRDEIVSFPGLLESLTRSLDGNVNLGLQVHLLKILQNLTATFNGPIWRKIMNSPVLLEGVAASLKKSENPELQVQAAWAIFNFAVPVVDQALKQEIANISGLLDNLEWSLDQDSNQMLQLRVARALITLERMEDTPKLLRILVESLELRDNPDIQNQAALGLIELVEVDDVSRDEIVNFPGLLDNLESSLDQDSNRMLQVLAAIVLISLERMEDTPKLLRMLVESLDLRDNPDIQNEAALGLIELVEVDDVSRDEIVNFPGLLDNLESSLDQDSNRMLQVLAAIVLISLERMKDTPKLLRILVESLELRDNPDIQNKAAWGLKQMVQVDDVSRDQIVSFPGLLDNLGSSLDQDSNRILQVLAATVLITLERMEYTPKLLRMLVECLELRDNPDIQNRAARGLKELVLVDDVSRDQIVSFLGLLNNLESSLDQDSNRMLQGLAASVLKRLERMEDTPKKIGADGGHP